MFVLYAAASFCLFLVVGAAPGLLDAAGLAGSIGGVVRDVKNVRGALDQNNYKPFDIEATPGGGGIGNGPILGGGDLKDTLNKISDCDPNIKGICCIMPNYCVPVAECSASKMSTNPFEILKAVPICTCPKGYKGDGRRGGSGCENIDECATGEALCEDLCQDMTPGYACGCRSGFRLNSNGFACDDINECSEGSAACTHVCENTPGSYTCSCPSGFELSSDGFTCLDINECDLMDELVLYQQAVNLGLDPPFLSPKAAAAANTLEMCQHSSLCSNLEGGYTCRCPLGFEVDSLKPSTCIDIDECAKGVEILEGLLPDNPLKKQPFLSNPTCKSGAELSATIPSQKCVNSEGAFECVCESGFELVSPATLGLSESPLKSNVGPESVDPEVQRQNARFQEAAGLAFLVECRDTDECAADVDPCTGESLKSQAQPEGQPEAESETGENLTSRRRLKGAESKPLCVNTVGGFECQCPDGFTHSPSSKACIDIDECQDPKMHLCDEQRGEMCVNSPGSYSCACGDGYNMLSGPEDGLSPGGMLELVCEDIDECKDGTHECASQCRNIPGSYTCECPKGFTPDANNRHQCQDINECDYRLCPTGTPCVNLPGTFVCGCPKSQYSGLKDVNVIPLLPKDVQRWLLVIQDRQNHANATSAAAFQEGLIRWTDPEFAVQLAKLESSLLSVSQCQVIDSCAALGKVVGNICPSTALCEGGVNGHFYCACPSGYQLSNDVSTSESVPTNAPTTTTILGGADGGLLGGLLGSGLGLFRHLQAVGSNGPTVDELLAPSDLNLGMALGLIKNPHSDARNFPLWTITHLFWDSYIASGGHLKDAQCADINECLVGVNADGQRVVCERKTPCCTNTAGSFYCSADRGLLSKFCPSGSINLAPFL